MDVGNLYVERLAARKAEAERLRARERKLSTARLLAIAAAIALAFWSVLVALAPLALFFVLVVVHARVLGARQMAERRAAFYERGLARVEGRWAGTGDGGPQFADGHHPYANDLDLFGRGSLFELISLAVTTAGRQRLADALKAPPAERVEIVSRQGAVQELRDRLGLREDLAVIASEVVREVEGADLPGWAARPPLVIAAALRAAAWIVPLLVIAAVAVSLPAMFARMVGMTHPEAAGRFGALADLPLWPVGLLIVIAVVLARVLHPPTEPIVIAVERTEPALALLRGVVARIGQEAFTAGRLVERIERVRGAAAEIERLRRLVALLDARRNQFFAPFAVLLLWTPNMALAIERWRTRNARLIVDAVEMVAELEMLSSLSSFAFEHPTFATPQIVEQGPLFDAKALGHPLIAEQRRVTNDLRLDDTLRLLVVSGSNMSGKSTMMRSTGLAAVLAMAGAPVCAQSLRIAPARVGASISIHDSLQENASRFYAEILRLRQVIELSRQGPLLFLLDEVLAGTNSHDRRIGAAAIVRGLVERGAIGLVSTHDLALAGIAEDLAPRAANVHFEDHIEDGKVVFDYRMRPGVVTKSNALELMRSVGIEV
jgi:hypothetical protein